MKTNKKYNWIMGFKNGFSKVELNKKYGFINTAEKEICPIKYDDVYDFQNGFSRVKLGFKHGFINEEGEEICLIKYDHVYDFQNGFAIVEINYKYGFINENGKEIIMGLSFDEMDKYRDDFTQSPYYKKYLMEKLIDKL